MRHSEFRRRKKLLFKVKSLELGDGLRQEGVGGPHVPDILRNDRASDWLAAHFAREAVRLDQQHDIVVEVGDNEWRVVNWPLQEYGYRIDRQGQTLYVYLVPHPHLRVLALDAGGIAGYFNARLLQKIHNRLQQKVMQFKQAYQDHRSRLTPTERAEIETFEGLHEELNIDSLQTDFLDDVDFLMGTSAGSVNAAILAQSDKPTSQLDECINVWREPRLFDNEPLSNLLAIYGLRSFVSFTKYKRSLSKYIPPKLRLKELKKDALFTTFALDPKDDSPRARPKIFNSANLKDEDELTLDVVLRSGSAAPLGAFHQGYADGGWYSPSPSSHIMPLFRWFKDSIAEDQEKLRGPLKAALARYWFVREIWSPMFPGMPIDYNRSYLNIVESLNKGEMPKALRIPFYNQSVRILDLESNGSHHDEVFYCEHRTVYAYDDSEASRRWIEENDQYFYDWRKYFYLHFVVISGESSEEQGEEQTPRRDLERFDLRLLDEYGGHLSSWQVTSDEKQELIRALRSEIIPSYLQSRLLEAFDDLYPPMPMIDFATQPVDIHTEIMNYQWRIELIVPDELLGFQITEQSLRKLQLDGLPADILMVLRRTLNQRMIWKSLFDDLTRLFGNEQAVRYKSLILKHVEKEYYVQTVRVTATPDYPGHPNLSFECLSRRPNRKKLQRWLYTISQGRQEAHVWDLYRIYENAPSEENWQALHDQALDFLLQKMEPETKLSLLSIGIGIKNKRLVMPKEDYHWGYLHLMVPSPLNQFFSLGSAMASAQADRATEEIHELAEMSDELNFHRIDPGVLSMNRFAYSALAIFPPFKDAVIALLENDLNKLEVHDDVETTAEWLFQHWILDDKRYRTFTDGSSARPRFPKYAEPGQPLWIQQRLPDEPHVQAEESPHPLQQPVERFRAWYPRS